MNRMREKCPYCDNKACIALLDYIRDNSFTLAEHTKRYFCHDNYERCARYKAVMNGLPPDDLGRLTPWDKRYAAQQTESGQQNTPDRTPRPQPQHRQKSAHEVAPSHNTWSITWKKRSDGWSSSFKTKS
jgi:hypothetical protein